MLNIRKSFMLEGHYDIIMQMQEYSNIDLAHLHFLSCRWLSFEGQS
jgi:hypothetical protein